jgi:hypothetical protein
MAHYRCYFLGATRSSAGASSSIDGAEDFNAETDDEAGTRAEALYRQRRNSVHGFEIWQAERLVLGHRMTEFDRQTRRLPDLAKRMRKGST